MSERSRTRSWAVPQPKKDDVGTVAARVPTAGGASQRLSRAVRRIHHPKTRIAFGCAVLVAILGIAFLYPTPYGPNQPSTGESLSAPSSEHIMGTDILGRDVFSRVVVAGRLDLPLALAGTGIAMLVGVALGLIVSVKARWSERLMRGIDMFQAFPLLVLAMVLVSVAGSSIGMVIFAVAAIFTPLFVRLVRAEALALRESRFVEAAVSIGAPRHRILLRHILPNVTGVILAQAAIAGTRAIIVIASLAFLGIGIEPPTASWGQMIKGGVQSLTSGQWWIAVFAGVPLVIVGYAFNQIADALEEVVGRGSRD